jgi:micrococcal nuclease
MNFLTITFLTFSLALLPAPREGHVQKIIDGDTIVVVTDGIGDMVRLIGIDTPELKHPEKPVERFAQEAADYATRMLLGKEVRSEFDQANNHVRHRDRYGRLLAYVYLGDQLFNAKIICDGYAHAYTKYPFSKMDLFRDCERGARARSKGLWGPTGQPSRAPPPLRLKPKATQQEEIVYITKTGKKYHKAGCGSLSKSMIKISRSEAEARGYGPCKRCWS